jgi:4-hydroxy-L-threonine phosphate dehydrogenase PdxA
MHDGITSNINENVVSGRRQKLLHKQGADAFIVMLHDQGHIAAKLLAPNQAAALSIGSPILFSSVAHGSAFDIAGKGIASPAAMIEAIARLAGVSARSG